MVRLAWVHQTTMGIFSVRVVFTDPAAVVFVVAFTEGEED